MCGERAIKLMGVIVGPTWSILGAVNSVIQDRAKPRGIGRDRASKTQDGHQTVKFGSRDHVSPPVTVLKAVSTCRRDISRLIDPSMFTYEVAGSRPLKASVVLSPEYTLKMRSASGWSSLLTVEYEIAGRE